VVDSPSRKTIVTPEGVLWESHTEWLETSTHLEGQVRWPDGQVTQLDVVTIEDTDIPWGVILDVTSHYLQNKPFLRQCHWGGVDELVLVSLEDFPETLGFLLACGWPSGKVTA